MNNELRRHFQNLWWELAGIADIQRIYSPVAVSRYLAKYVPKGGELDLSPNLPIKVPPLDWSLKLGEPGQASTHAGRKWFFEDLRQRDAQRHRSARDEGRSQDLVHRWKPDNDRNGHLHRGTESSSSREISKSIAM